MRIRLMAAGLAVPLLFVACGGDDGESTSTEPVPDDPDAVLVADDLEFDTDELTVPSGEPVTIVIDNRDDGVDHNVHVKGAPEPNKTALEAGPSQQALTLELSPGEYDFVCDIHPQMKGVVVAE